MDYADDSLVLHTDFYELNMMYTYWQQGISERNAVFECYFRDLPFGSGFAVFAGLEHAVDYLQHLRFTDSDLAYLKESTPYPQGFLDYLRDLKFTCTVRSAVEGDLVFNNEPMMQVEGPLAQAQLVETALLNILNYQTLVATKAARIRAVVGDDPLMEFGTRRAQETSAAIWGTRAAYIGGFNSTSNVRAGKLFGIPIAGTHAHALVQAYRDDYEAFKAYAEVNHDVTFLVDTYDTLRSGVPAAIKVAKEMGDKIDFQGVRIDSGDMAYISKRVRQQLDEAGFTQTKIVASNDLDENTIQNLKMQGAKIDIWGIGTKLITAYDHPALGAVYKLVSIEDESGKMVDTIKLSSNAEKVSTPGKKQVWRITRRSNGKSEGDFIARDEEEVAGQDELYMFHPSYPYINKTVKDFNARPVLQTIFDHGELVYQLPTLDAIRAFCLQSVDSLWDEYTRVLNPQEYPVDLSQQLWDDKMDLIKHVKVKVQKQQL
ncbi:nicotinate phosphoribosyltransferase [Lacticaseibacillus camelliae]|uniref:Nicotinate phosphoribosyltransferase n=1 Tax=Lacticaseibacillus camelliae DSM 22697 = JCM 13995 TaxID=1423730 RepID=A0A0R2F578_9LACO|nr:nicotinate phosphoribosyltransferase [Lacticaseibacillus camelliae]KRN23585.1 nicotinate phosphoribosyltransferase [Lacticaseibacillus camelliae DSM 22697 = JCM 13995]